MQSPAQSTEVSLNDKVAAVATVLCNGHLHVMNRDPFVAVIPPGAPDATPLYLRSFPFEAAGTIVVEISSPIATKVPSLAAIDDWAVRQGHGLYNVYVVREETNTDELGSVLKAQSSIIATDLTVPVLELALDILAATAPRLATEFRDRFADSSEAPATFTPRPPLEPGMSLPANAQHPLSAQGHSVGHVMAMPGYL